ncbi:hypothetical protein B9Z65_7583 [Elsinoe australis]|uniref:Uncharacterized protein n=1 Tax=Elsinoe australis TaxID=40998 RepID=A0A2P7ZZZ3_9PEZI|nr:hypothetical protein B9Z65_7583 [Elsinoe australis]
MKKPANALNSDEDLRAAVIKCSGIVETAVAKSVSSPGLEVALIRAPTKRYSIEGVVHDFSNPNKNYADAMREVYQKYGEDDLDVTTLFADALMNWKPRQLFRSKTGKAIDSSPVLEIRAVLERGSQHPDGKKHPGTPHIATVADDKFFARQGGVNFYSFYRLHNYHSLIYAAMLAGQSRVALESVDRMEGTITEAMLLTKSPPMANWLEFFLAVRVHVLIRFGLWSDLKALPIPTDQVLYCTTTAMTHYGKAIAHAATNDVAQADVQRALSTAAAFRVPPSRLDFPNRIVDILKVATSMLDGEIAYRQGDVDVAFQHLLDAIVHEDNLQYTEPWGWMLPARHPYGALSLEQGRVEQARRAYAEDLGLEKTLTRAHAHPRNVWALSGYYECLVGLGREEEAREVQEKLVVAKRGADVDVASSCCCRLGTEGGCVGKGQGKVCGNGET